MPSTHPIYTPYLHTLSSPPPPLLVAPGLLHVLVNRLDAQVNTLSTHPIYTPYLHILSPLLIAPGLLHVLVNRLDAQVNTPCRYTLSTHPIYAPYLHTLSAHTIIMYHIQPYYDVPSAQPIYIPHQPTYPIYHTHTHLSHYHQQPTISTTSTLFRLSLYPVINMTTPTHFPKKRTDLSSITDLRLVPPRHPEGGWGRG